MYERFSRIRRHAPETLLRVLLLLPTLLFGLSRLSLIALVGCLALLFLHHETSSSRAQFRWKTWAACFLLFAVTLADRPIQGPTNFPTWSGINERSYILSVDYFEPAFETVNGEKFTLVYYFGVHALVGVIHRIVPEPWQGEIALETIMALLAVSYSALGLTLILSGDSRFARAPVSLAIIILFLPGIEVVPFLLRSLLGEFPYTLWPYTWLGFDRDFGTAAQPEPGWSLAWVPQHAALLFLQAYFWFRSDGNESGRLHDRCMVIVSAMSTSVFFAFGWIIALVLERGIWSQALRINPRRAFASLFIVAAIGLDAAWYYAHKIHPESVNWTLTTWDLSPFVEFWIMVGFVLVENFWLLAALALGVLIPLRRGTIHDEMTLAAKADARQVILIFISLAFLAQIRVGIFNDLYMRASTPLVLLATLYVAKWLSLDFNKPLRAGLVVIALTTGLFLQVGAHFVEEHPTKGAWRGMRADEWRSPETTVNKQYRGRLVSTADDN